MLTAPAVWLEGCSGVGGLALEKLRAADRLVLLVLAMVLPLA